MGQIKGNYESEVHGLDNLLLGQNVFESAKLKLAAGASVADGGVVVRDTDGNFIPATAANIATNAPAILVERDGVTNGGAAASTYPVRVCIGGRVKLSLVKVGEDELTDAQCDNLRDYGIYAVDMVNAGEVEQ